MFSVSRRVSAPGCFEMTSMTAGRPLTEASPRLTWAASATRATWPSTTGLSPVALMTTDVRSSSDWIRPSERTSSSFPP